ncbi:MAG: hypothetical protein F6K00_05310 [Leptolyngbya sp. SIOISBB]|nr:hypothetical protein [Leptolyngbya sp. SIOISBB]
MGHVTDNLALRRIQPLHGQSPSLTSPRLAICFEGFKPETSIQTYSLFPIPYSLLPIPCFLFPAHKRDVLDQNAQGDKKAEVFVD